jgi:hypothetical protein
VISQVWKKFVAEVKPIENLQHWMNNVISSEYRVEIRDATGERSGIQWQLLKQTRGAKAQVDRELAAEFIKPRPPEPGVDSFDPELIFVRGVMQEYWNESPERAASLLTLIERGGRKTVR